MNSTTFWNSWRLLSLAIWKPRNLIWSAGGMDKVTYGALRILGVRVSDLFREIENMKQHPTMCNNCLICQEAERTAGVG